MDRVVPGSCLCGAVTFRLRGPSRFVAHCHCTQCRRAHGAAFVTWAGFPESALAVQDPSGRLRERAAPAHGRRASCSECGSPLFFREPRWPDEVHVAVGSLSAPLGAAPQAHVFFDDRAGFAEVLDGLARAGGPEGTRPLPRPELRALGTGSDELAALDALLARAPGYHLRVEGAPAAPGAAARMHAEQPPPPAPASKEVLGVFDAGALIGCVDLLLGWPTATTAMLGLLLLDEAHQGQGWGSASYRELEHRVRAPAGITRIRIGVLCTNAQVLPFWTGLGFVATGEVKPYRSGPVRSEVLVLEKALLP